MDEPARSSETKMLRRLSVLPRRFNTRASAPAICAVQLMPKEGKSAELEAWLVEGRSLLETALHSQRPRAAVPGSWIVGSEVRSCYHWVHMPSPNQGHPDTVAIVFTNDEDLSHWRQSPLREDWLKSGVAQGLARDGRSILVDTEKITLQKDDGSLGGWLASDQEAASAGSQMGQRDLVAPPPQWKVAATVMLAMYPVQELNRLALLPALATTAQWQVLHPTVQVFFTCVWTCGAVTVGLLPHARSLSEQIGFIGGRSGCPGPLALAQASLRLLLLYGGLIGLGIGINASCGPVQNRGVWSALPPEPVSCANDHHDDR